MALRDRLATPYENFDASDCTLADCIYDLTLAKYSNFPNDCAPASNPEDYGIRASGVDCRKYYGAFLTSFDKMRKGDKIKSSSQEEYEAGRLLQKMVFRNFYWSKLECSRITPFSKRYEWVFEGKKIYLWYPSYMIPKEFRAWLKENVKDLNPKAPDAKNRIQSLIDENLGRGYHIPFEDTGIANTSVAPSITIQEEQMFGRRLAVTVAREKAKNPKKLRPSIRKLGKQSVEQFILQIFTEIECDDYDITRMAKQYGISTAALSRFAGSTWYEKMGTDEPVRVPDLWKNTARVLAGNPIFMQTVLESRIAGRFEEVLRLIKTQKVERDDE
jgi:hypothetical protein